MILRNIKSKKVSALLLVSLLMLSFCLLPCGNMGLLNAEAASHSGMEMASAHSCNSTAAADAPQLKAFDDSSCIHCDTDFSATIQSPSWDYSKFRADISTGQTLLSGIEQAKQYIKWTALRPPSPGTAIHLLNSVLII